MENKSNNGGPAFPLPKDRHLGDDYKCGMSLRDYFAAKASEEDISEIMCRLENTEFDGCERVFKITRQQAKFIHADAMLKAREK
jgi:hypothetical protein